MQSYDIPLHDIKPLVEIQEYSLYYLLGTIGLALLTLFAFLYIGYYFYKKSKIISQRVQHKKLLNDLDLNDTKNTAYALSNYTLTFKSDSEEHAKLFQLLNEQLESFKYRKNVEKFDKKTLIYIESYKALINA